LLPPFLEVVLQQIEARDPEFPVAGEPLVEIGERLGADPIEAPLRIDSGFDEPGVLQYAQVLRHGRLADAEVVDEGADGLFAVPEELEDRNAPRLCEYLECG
jgi:hypothetical protein